MSIKLPFITLTGVALLLACSSKPLDHDSMSAAGSASAPTGGSASSDPTPNPCSAALRQSLSLLEEVSTAKITTLSNTEGERELYVDASVGGPDGQPTHPWLYLELASGQAVPVDDLQALDSKAWDLAFKRSVIRTNGGDSGPGQGGAIRIGLPWDKVDTATLGEKKLPVESWFNQDCELALDASQNLITTFSGWSEYDQTEHVLSAAPDVTFITAAADGSLYKVAILDYYSNPSGAHGSVSGRYKVRVATLP